MATHTAPLTDSFYKTLLDSLFDAVFVVDAEGIITYWNKSCERITGYPAEEMIGNNYLETPFARLDDEQTQKPGGIAIAMEQGLPGTWKGYVRRKNGQRIPVESHISPLSDETGALIGAAEVLRDISAHVALEQAHQQVLAMSRKDQLTGLLNRGAINDVLKTEIERCRRYHQSLSVVMIDIDHFKHINDRHGHEAGDRVLAKLGAIFLHNLRQPDVVGRWGGEEFLIIAPGSRDEQAAELAQRLRRYINAVAPPDVPETISASFGVTQFQAYQSLDQLLYVADMAMYQAKNTGRDRVVIAYADDYSPPDAA
ncbi:MAG: GGDEF domain-containing protein [Sedimentisphaerales bacterium]|nr:GGDEF domain-containing protein [Sedimentisphaerales bacterium]